MDRLDTMQVMLTAVECGSLSKASRKLGQPLATVSRKVSDLECHLKLGPPGPLGQGLGTDTCRPDLHLVCPNHPGAAERGRARRGRRIHRAQGRSYRHCPDNVWPATRLARRHRFPREISQGVRRADADRSCGALSRGPCGRRLADRPSARQRPDRHSAGRRAPGDVRKPGVYRLARGAGRSAGSRRPRCRLVRERVVAHALALLVGLERACRNVQIASQRENHRRGDRCGPSRRRGGQSRLLSSPIRSPTMCAIIDCDCCSKPVDPPRLQCT